MSLKEFYGLCINLAYSFSTLGPSQILHYPSTYELFAEYWRSLSKKGQKPWQWITQIPLHESNVNWTRAPIIVFNEHTPEYDQFEIGSLMAMVRFQKVLDDASKSNNYDADRHNFQFTAGTKCGQCTTDQCPISKVMMPKRELASEWNREGQILSCLAVICHAFQAGDVLPMAELIRRRPDIAIRRLFFAMGPSNYFDAVSIVVYLRREWLKNPAGCEASPPPSPPRVARNVTVSKRDGKAKPNSAHFDVHNCPYLGPVCVMSKGVGFVVSTMDTQQVITSRTEYVRSLVIGITRKSATDSWSNMMAVMQMTHLARQYMDTIPAYLQFHDPNYCPLESHFWASLFDQERNAILNSLVPARTLSSHKALDVVSSFCPILLDMAHFFQLDLLQQYELHAVLQLDACSHQAAFIGMAWMASGVLPNRTGTKGNIILV